MISVTCHLQLHFIAFMDNPLSPYFIGIYTIAAHISPFQHFAFTTNEKNYTSRTGFDS